MNYLSLLLQTLLHLGRPRPTPIPQFLLDAAHPWLIANKAWLLAHYPDAGHGLCQLDSPFWKLSDDHTHPSPPTPPPADLFADLVIENVNLSDGGGGSRLGWTNAADRLREMRACPAALAGVRHLHVYVYVRDTAYTAMSCVEPTQPPAGLPELMADVLADMPGLTQLDWAISSSSSSSRWGGGVAVQQRAFEGAFVERGLMLPSVRELRPGPWSDFLVSRCPGLEVLTAGAWEDHGHWLDGGSRGEDARMALVRAATGLPLRELRLGIGAPGWRVAMVQGRFEGGNPAFFFFVDVALLWLTRCAHGVGILDAVPNITSLRLAGSLKRTDTDGHCDPACRYKEVKDGATLKVGKPRPAFPFHGRLSLVFQVVVVFPFYSPFSASGMLNLPPDIPGRPRPVPGTCAPRPVLPGGPRHRLGGPTWLWKHV